MFFASSKILYFIIQPIVWLVGSLFWALFRKDPFKRHRILRGVFWGLVLLTNPFLSNRVFHAWEYPAVDISTMQDTFDVGVVLGGYCEFDVYPNKDRLNLSDAVNRLSDAVVIYKKCIIKKILLTGGDGRLLGEKVNESDNVLAFLLTLGIPESDILVENKSKNTRENAVFTKNLLENKGLKDAKCLLITSAFHMRRSIGCFNKTGLNFIPFPAHFVAQRIQADMKSTILPDPLMLWKWEVFIKEWIGYGVYWLQGYV